jgi:uncharacterized membrane protein YbhN (UPF0104 family)
MLAGAYGTSPLAVSQYAEVGGVRTFRTVLGWSAANWLLDAAALWILFFGFGHLAFC